MVHRSMSPPSSDWSFSVSCDDGCHSFHRSRASTSFRSTAVLFVRVAASNVSCLSPWCWFDTLNRAKGWRERRGKTIENQFFGAVQRQNLCVKRVQWDWCWLRVFFSIYWKFMNPHWKSLCPHKLRLHWITHVNVNWNCHFHLPDDYFRSSSSYYWRVHVDTSRSRCPREMQMRWEWCTLRWERTMSDPCQKRDSRLELWQKEQRRGRIKLFKPTLELINGFAQHLTSRDTYSDILQSSSSRQIRLNNDWYHRKADRDGCRVHCRSWSHDKRVFDPL